VERERWFIHDKILPLPYHPGLGSGTSSIWWSSVMRVWFALVSVSLSKVLILNPSASPVWLPYKTERK